MEVVLVLTTIVWILAVLGLARLVVSFIKVNTAQKTMGETEDSLNRRGKQVAILNTLYAQAYIYSSKDERINKLLDDIYNMLGWEAVAYWEFDEEEQSLEMKYQRGLAKGYLDTLQNAFHNKIPVGSFAGGRAITTKQPVVVNDWYKDPHLKGIEFLSESGHIYSFAAFPIATMLKTYGNLHVYGTLVNRFKLNEVQFFTTVSNSLAAILQNDELAGKGVVKNEADARKSKKDN